jgi:hypothetical protein
MAVVVRGICNRWTTRRELPFGHAGTAVSVPHGPASATQSDAGASMTMRRGQYQPNIERTRRQCAEPAACFPTSPQFPRVLLKTRPTISVATWHDPRTYGKRHRPNGAKDSRVCDGRCRTALLLFVRILFGSMVGGMEPLGASALRRAADARSGDDLAAFNHAFLPFPAELADMIRRKAISPNLGRLLSFRIFADPRTGVWETTMRDIMDLLILGRSACQKLVHRGMRDNYIHARFPRLRTVRTIIHNGGFPLPAHIKLGLPRLRWDTDVAVRRVLALGVENSVVPRPFGESQPQSDTAGTEPGDMDRGLDTKNPTVVPNTNSGVVREIYLSNESNERNESTKKTNERTQHAAGSGDHPKAARDYVPVHAFTPDNDDEETVRDLAVGLGEKTINNFLSLYLTYGLARLRNACRMTHDRLRGRTKPPLREKPGAYVQWLLKTGRC